MSQWCRTSEVPLPPGHWTSKLSSLWPCNDYRREVGRELTELEWTSCWSHQILVHRWQHPVWVTQHIDPMENRLQWVGQRARWQGQGFHLSLGKPWSWDSKRLRYLFPIRDLTCRLQSIRGHQPLAWLSWVSLWRFSEWCPSVLFLHFRVRLLLHRSTTKLQWLELSPDLHPSPCTRR